MIKRITKVSDSSELNDDYRLDMSKGEDPRGRSIEPDDDFTIYYRDNREWIPSEDSKFIQGKKYKYREPDSTRSSDATPVRLHLYVDNGITYVPSRDTEFKPNVLYYSLEGDGNYKLASPYSLELKELSVPKRLYYYPALKTPHGYITLCGANGESWEEAKDIYEWGKQNRELLLEQYRALMARWGDPKEVRKKLQNFISRRSEFRAARATENHNVRASAVEIVTNNRRQTRAGTVFGNPVLVNSVCEKYKLTPAQLDPHTNEYAEAVREDEEKIEKAQQEAYGFKFDYAGGNYYIPNRRTPNTVAVSKIISEDKYNDAWFRARTIEDLTNKQNVMSRLLLNFKNSLIDAETLKDYLMNPMEFNLINDSATRLVKDNGFETVSEENGIYYNPSSKKYAVELKTPFRKNIHLGDFRNEKLARLSSRAFKDANCDPIKFIESDFYSDNAQHFKKFYQDYVTREAVNDSLRTILDEGNLVVESKRLGIYYNEDTEQYVVLIKTPSNRLIRLGNFEMYEDAKKASEEFTGNSNYDPIKFAESEIYLKNVELFKDFYNSYVKGKTQRDVEASKMHVEKQSDGTFKVYYDMGEETVYVNRVFYTEAEALQCINELLSAGNVKRAIDEMNSKSSRLNRNINNLGVSKAVKNEALTYTDMKDIAKVIAKALSGVDADTAEQVLTQSREKEEHGKLYLSVIDFTKEKILELGYSQEQADRFVEQYQLMLSAQETLMRKVIAKLIDKEVKVAVEETHNGDLYREYRMNRDIWDRERFWDSNDDKLTERGFAYYVTQKVLDDMPFDRPTYDKQNNSLREKVRLYYDDYLDFV